MGFSVRAFAAAVLPCVGLCAASSPAQTVSVHASVETVNVPSAGDAADDPAIWIHPTDPALSTIIATDKNWGLLVYGLDGREIQRVSGARPNNVDLRYNFPLGADRVAIVAASDRQTGRILLFRVDPATRRLVNVAARDIATGLSVNGLCLYFSPVTRTHHVFVSSLTGTVQQWALFDAGAGLVDAELVRTIEVGSGCEGLVADDEYAALYASEETETIPSEDGVVSIWRYGAEPGDGTARTMIGGGLFGDDIEGLSLHYRGNATGYLVASDQDADSFVVFRREGGNAFVKRFRIASKSPIDGVTHTDGIDCVSFPLGPRFPNGLFVAQDDVNSSSRQNFKLVPWERIAGSGAAMAIDTGFDPRTIGGPANRKPAVWAGDDRKVTLEVGVLALAGVALDDGLPGDPGELATRWTLVSGPAGGAAIGVPESLGTSVTFVAPGTYVFRLEASDGDIASSDDVAVTVTDGVPTISVQRRVAFGADDAEQESTGSVNRTSTDLELATGRTVGIRFTSLAIPPGAEIASAYLQFTADEIHAGATALLISGDDRDTSPSLGTGSFSISSRPRTAAVVEWSPAPWNTIGEAAEAQRTPDLRAIVQEIVDRAGWQSGNAISFLVSGTGKRVGVSRDRSASLAPLLVVEYAEE